MEPTTDPERQIEDAREKLVAHLGELGRRLKEARARLDFPAQIAARPLVTVGAAFAVGALLGLRAAARRHRAEPREGGLGRAVLAGLGALTLRVAKELALRSAAQAARGWWEQHQQASMSEVRTSYDPHMEPFLRH
jgi:hypothetical protein